MIKLMDTVSLLMLIMHSMKVNGVMISNMDMGLRHGKMEHQNIQDYFIRVKRMAKANLNGKMEVFTREILWMDPSKDLASITSQILISGTKENSE